MDKPLHVSAGSIQALTWGVMLGWHHCVGVRAPEHRARNWESATLVTELSTEDVLDPEDSKPDSPTVSGPFKPGYDPRRNSHGRPKKGESFAEKYRKQVEKNAGKLVKAHIERAKGSGVVASREFALAAAYTMGRPVQPYLNVGGDDPLALLFTELADHKMLASGEQDTQQDITQDT